MSALSFKINAETEKLERFVSGLERMKRILTDLPSGTKEFDIINGKIAEMEKRVEQSMKKIATMQNKMVLSVPAPTGGNAVAKESASYESLINSLNDVLGARGQNVSSMLQEQKAIQMLQKELSVLERVETGGLNLSEAQKTRRLQIVASLIEHKQALSSLRQVLANDIKLGQAATTSMNEMSQSLARMRMAYRELDESSRNSKFGQDLLNNIQDTDMKIKELDATIGNHQRNVGNYSSRWDGLGMSIQQVAREFPSLAYGPKVFFSAISNNLPILSDELKKAKEEYKALIAQGQKATPVWKQVVTSLFSWQTALTVGVTLLTLYGDKLVDWVANAFRAKEASKTLTEAQDDINEKMSDGSSGVGEQIVKLQILRDQWKSLGDDINAQQKFIRESEGSFDDLGVAIMSINDAENLLVNQTPAFIEALTLRAEAAVALKLAAEEIENSEKKKREIEAENTKGPSGLDKFESYFVTTSLASNGQLENQIKQEDVSAKSFHENKIRGLEDEKKAADDAAKSYYDLYINKFKAAAKILKDANINEGGKSLNSDKDKGNTLSQQIIDNENKLQAERIAIIQDGRNKRLLQSEIEWKEKKSSLDKEYAETKKSYEELGKLMPEEVTTTYKARLIENDKAKTTRDTNINIDADNEFKARQKEITAFMQTEEDKRQDAIKERYDKERDWAEKQYKGGNMTESEYKTYLVRINTVEAQDGLKSLLDKYQDYDTKRREIEEKFTADYNALEKQRTPENSKQITAAQGELGFKKDETLKQVTEEFASREEEFQSWMDHIANMSLEQLGVALRQAENELGHLRIAGKGGTQLAVAEQKVKNAKEAIKKEQSKKKTESPDKRSLKDWKDLNDVLNDANKSFKEIGDSVGGVAGELISTAGEITASTLSMINGITTLAEWSVRATELTAKGVSESIQSVEKASVILAVISAAVQIATKIASLLKGKNKAAEDSERLSKVTDKIAETNEIVNRLIERRVELIKKATAAEREGLQQSTEDIIKIQKQRAELEFQKLQGNEILGKKGKNNDLNVEDLGINNIKDLKDFLSSQRLLDLEAAGYSLTDKDKWESIVKNRDELNDQALQFQETTAKMYTGINFDEAKDGLDDLLMSADTTMKDISDNFEDYMRKSILNIVKQTYLDDEMKKWYDDFSKRTADDDLSEGDLNESRKDYERIREEAQKRINDKLAAAGISLDSSEQSASSAGFETMSQDTGSELNGRFTALQAAGEETKNQSMKQTESIVQLLNSMLSIQVSISDQQRTGDELLQYAVQSYMELQTISDHTGSMNKTLIEMNERLVNIERSSKSLAGN